MKLIFLLLATAITCRAAAAADPAAAAIAFLEKVRLDQLNLTPNTDTALSPHTREPKQAEILKRLERVRQDLGSDPLEIGPIKMDDTLAAVLVRKINDFDLSRTQIFSLALVKRGDSWQVAPVLASFENTDAGPTIALKNRLATLENWMLREQVSDLEKVRNQSNERLRQKIQVSLPLAEFKKLTAEELAQRFLTACQQRDLPALLGMLGGLSTEPPDDWADRLKLTETALRSTATAEGFWYLLTDPLVPRVAIRQQKSADSVGSFSIACLNLSDSSAAPRVTALDFELVKTADGLWQIDPPEQFFEEDSTGEEEEEDADLSQEFATAWQAIHPPQPQPTAQLAQQALTAAVRTGDLATLFQLAHLSGETLNSKSASIVIARLWQTLHAPATACHPLPLMLREKDEMAVALYQFFIPREPDRNDFQNFYFTKTETGWLWSPVATDDQLENFRELLAADSKQWRNDWQRELMSESIEIDTITDQSIADPAAAQKVVDDWFQATRGGDIKAALALTAHLPDPKGDHAILRNLGHEMNAARKTDFKLTAASVLQGKVCTAVGMKIDRNGKLSYPLYPVIQTKSGPRILIEIDLFAAASRNFLNKTSLEHLQNAGFAPAADDLRQLIRDFQKSIEPNH